jgi:hypothetical protein
MIKTASIPFLNSEISIASDSKDVYIHESLFNCAPSHFTGFRAPYPGFVTREGFIHLLSFISSRASIPLINWYRDIFMIEASLFFKPLESVNGMVRFDNKIIQCIEKQNHIYYKLNDITSVMGFAKHSQAYQQILLMRGAVLGPVKQIRHGI